MSESGATSFGVTAPYCEAKERALAGIDPKSVTAMNHLQGFTPTLTTHKCS